jgi:hypothetical protein
VPFHRFSPEFRVPRNSFVVYLPGKKNITENDAVTSHEKTDAGIPAAGSQPYFPLM